MKIRSGFVSNSSSSSFVVVLPDNFIEIVDYSKIEDIDDEFPLDDFQSLLRRIMVDGGICDNEIYEYEREKNYEIDYEFYDVFYNLIEPYIITSFETGPGFGQFNVYTKSKIEEKLKKI